MSGFSGGGASGGASGGGRTLLIESDVAGVNVAEFTAFDPAEFAAYSFEFDNVSLAQNARQLWMQCGLDASYFTGSSDYRWSRLDASDQSDGRVYLTASMSGLGAFSGTLRTIGPHMPMWTPFEWKITAHNSDQTAIDHMNGVAFLRQNSAVNKVKFFANSGGFSIGKIRMYGEN